MFRLPFARLVPALLAACPLAALAQAPADSVVRTTTVTTVTTTTVTKPAAAGSKPTSVPTTSSTSSTTTTTAAPAPAAAPRSAPAGGDLTGARPRSTVAPAPAPVPVPKSAATAKPKATTTTTAAAPATRRPATGAAPATAPARRPAATTDPEVVRLLQTDVDLTLVRAERLPNLYERFLETTRAERRQWTTAQWTSAGAMLTRLNERYEQVRGDLSLEEKLNIRTLQGEFRGLEAAKQVSKRL